MSTIENASQADLPKGRKCDQVMAGARAVFVKNGYEGASVDDIAKAAGVSKATLYSYFPDKKLLFQAVIRAEFRKQADRVFTLDNHERPVAEVLLDAARSFVAFLCSPFGLEIYRVAVAEARRFPEIGKDFYTSGPDLARRRLSAFMEGAAARGELRVDDPVLAAGQFSELCKTEIFPRLLFDAQAQVTRRDREHVAQEAVKTFLARYGA